jgi:hypothetical protein
LSHGSSYVPLPLKKNKEKWQLGLRIPLAVKPESFITTDYCLGCT